MSPFHSTRSTVLFIRITKKLRNKFNREQLGNPVTLFSCWLPKAGMIRASTTCTVYAFSRTLQSELTSVEFTQHVLCDKCSRW